MKPNKSAAEIEEEEFIERMLSAYDDKDFEDPHILSQISQNAIDVNIHSGTLVLTCIIKLLDLLEGPLVEALPLN